MHVYENEFVWTARDKTKENVIIYVTATEGVVIIRVILRKGLKITVRNTPKQTHMSQHIKNPIRINVGFWQTADIPLP